jgi:hypothetical protein
MPSGTEQPRLVLKEPRLPRTDALTPLLLMLMPARPPILMLGGDIRTPLLVILNRGLRMENPLLLRLAISHLTVTRLGASSDSRSPQDHEAETPERSTLRSGLGGRGSRGYIGHRTNYFIEMPQRLLECIQLAVQLWQVAMETNSNTNTS